MSVLRSAAPYVLAATSLSAAAQNTSSASEKAAVPAVQLGVKSSEPAPQLSPKSAYVDAMHPLDLTRHSIANWSGAEISALKVSIDRAREACKARNPHSYIGADLIDLARLCGLGQEWGTVVLATTLYIDAPATAPKPLLPDAHAARVDADLRLHSQPDALRDTHAMYAAVPYTPITAEASDEAISYMTFSTPDDAVTLAAERQPFILARLKQLSAPALSSAATTPLSASSESPNTVTTPESSITVTTATAPQATVHELYTQGMVLATLQQQANKPAEAAATLAELDRSLPAAIATDDSLQIAEDRRRYALLGKPLSGLVLNRSLSMPNNIPAIPATNSLTVLLLFPDWCAQCIAAMDQVPETVFRIAGHEAYYYGLLAETMPEKKPDTSITTQQLGMSFSPAYAASLLAEKPVVTVPISTLQQFAAKDYPFLMVTDPQGIVRVAQAIDTDDVVSGGKVDAAVSVIGQRWPQVMPHPAVPAHGPTPSALPNAQ